MSGRDQHKRPGKSGQGSKPGAGDIAPSTPRPPQAAAPPVITSTPLPEAEATSPAQPWPPVRSGLVGDEGEVPPMAAREVQTPAEDVPDVTEAKVDAKPAADLPGTSIPPTTSKPAAPPPPAPARRSGFWPLVLGGAVAAGLGAGATLWLMPQPTQPEPVDVQALKDQILADLPPPPATDPAALPDAVAAALAEALPQLESSAREAAAEEVARGLSEATTQSSAPEAVTAALQALATRVDALDQQLAEQTGTTEDGAAEAALAAMQSDLATLQAQLADLAARPAGATADSVTELGAQLAALSPRLDALEQQEGARTAALAAAAQLAAALHSGSGRDAAAEALTDAGHADMADLARSVPSLADLQAGFDRAARDAISADRAATPPAPGISLLGSILADQTKARSVVPREGDDVDAIQSRAGAAVEAGDIPAALAELAAMPEAARAAMAPWLAQAEAFAAAQGAIDQITQPAPQSE